MRTVFVLILLLIAPALLLAAGVPDGVDFPTRRASNAIKAEYKFHDDLVRIQYYWWERGYLWVEDVPINSQFTDILIECGFKTEQNGLECGGLHYIYSPYHRSQNYCGTVKSRTIFFIDLMVGPSGCTLNPSNKFYLFNYQYVGIDGPEVLISGNPNHAYGNNNDDDDDDSDDPDTDNGGGGGGCFIQTIMGSD